MTDARPSDSVDQAGLAGAVRIDAHHHVWNLDARPQPWTDDLPAMRRSFTFDELAPMLDRHRFEGTVVVQTVNEPDETPELLALACSEPRIRGVVGWVDLTSPAAADRITYLRGLPGGERLVGIRHQVQYESGEWLARDDVRRGIATLGDLRLVYELVVTAAQLRSVVAAVTALPQVSFVLDHAGKPPIASRALEPWAARIAELAALPNVVCKVSGLATEAGPGWNSETLRPYVDVLAGAFGPTRLMFGSDWPVCLLAGSYDEIVAETEALVGAWSAHERAALFGATAARVYGLTAAAR